MGVRAAKGRSHCRDEQPLMSWQLSDPLTGWRKLCGCNYAILLDEVFLCRVFAAHDCLKVCKVEPWDQLVGELLWV